MENAFFSITVGGWLFLAVIIYLYITVASRGPSGPEAPDKPS
jgi:hypothetical protein